MVMTQSGAFLQTVRLDIYKRDIVCRWYVVADFRTSCSRWNTYIHRYFTWNSCERLAPGCRSASALLEDAGQGIGGDEVVGCW